MSRGKKIPIGVQLYSVRDDCKKDFPGVLEAIAEMGYDGVEFAGYHDRSAKEIRKMLDDNGLKACGTHTAMNTLEGDNFQKTVDFNKEIGNIYLIVPWLDEKEHKTKQAWLARAAQFNELDEKARDQNMRVGYHNHMFEFTPIDGELPWDIFFGNTNKSVIMQFDTGNALHGGGNPLPFLKKYPGRAVTVHVKEYSATNPKALVGEGDINWKELFEVCETIGGTEWYIVEQEQYPYPPLESIDRCLKNLRSMGK
ncbi:MAG: sugar phosphate isomerase/epimerase [Candidatus Latescibacteria bacterium]|nr:sugar phosphate isomerase/epimerase [Candidatus Latescibacterota bacterium]